MKCPTVPHSTGQWCRNHTFSECEGGRGGLSQGLYFIDCEFSEGLTCTDPNTATKTETETQPLGMNVDTLLIEASEPGDNGMDGVQGHNDRRNCLEELSSWHQRAELSGKPILTFTPAQLLTSN